jgi:hypothetical protein
LAAECFPAVSDQYRKNITVFQAKPDSGLAEKWRKFAFFAADEDAASALAYVIARPFC